MISGIITAILLAAFAAITGWAYSARQRDRFADASQLPLRDEPTPMLSVECRMANAPANECCCHGASDSTLP